MKIELRYRDSREAPLYKATEKLLYQVDDLFDFLQRGRKHTHGQHMLQIVLEMLDCVSLAYDFPGMRAEQLKLFLTRYQGEDKEPIQWLVRMIVLHRPELRCIRKGDVHLWDVLPAGKTLFGIGGKTGLAIGNLTSQIFANYYLLPLDQWLASVPGVEYGRYVDAKVCIPCREFGGHAGALGIQRKK